MQHGALAPGTASGGFRWLEAAPHAAVISFDEATKIETVEPQESRAGGGAVFIGGRDGDLDVFVDAIRAGEALELIDVEDGEYTSAYRVDGAVLELLDDDGLVVLDLSGDVDEAGLQSLISRHGHDRPTTRAADQPLDFAEAWLREEWEHELSRRPRWLHRRLNPPRPPTRDELAAPPGVPSPRLVRPRLLREVVAEVLALLPRGAVTVVEGTEGRDSTVHLHPRAAGAVDVLLRYRLLGVDIHVAGSAPIEVAAPVNINCAPPHRFWRDDVHDVLHAVSHGRAHIAVDSTGAAHTVELPGGRLGVTAGSKPDRPVTRPTAWEGPPPDRPAGPIDQPS